MAGAPTSRGKRVAAINVTPLVDVTLVLLIIFMVTATYIARRVFDVKLPTAASGDTLQDPPLVILVQADRSIAVGDERFDLAGLAERVQRPDGPDGKPATRAIIAADERVDYGRVAKVIDTLRLAGISDFGLEIRTDEVRGVGTP